MDAVIQPPPNLFFGTSIATCVLVLKKSKTDTSILFVDASREFVHEGNKNKLTDGNIKHILNTLNARKDYDHIATLVSNTDIINNDSNLSVSSYVTKEDTREKVDIGELNKKIADIVACEDELRHSIDAMVADLEGDAR